MIVKRESKEKGVIRVFVASPSDVGELRSKVLDALEKEFRIMGYVDLTGYRIETIGWEELPPINGMPQDVINEALLANADIVIGIIKHRLGTPVKDLTTNIARARSGTVEEMLYALVEDVIDEKRPYLMAYFYDKEPTISGLTDPDLDKKRNEWQDIQDFKELLKNKVIFTGYGDDNEKELMRLCKHIRSVIELCFNPIQAHISIEALEKLKEKAQSPEQFEELKKRYAELESQLAGQNDKKEALEEFAEGNFDKTEERLLETLKIQKKRLNKKQEDVAQTYFDLAKLKELELRYQDATYFYLNATELAPHNAYYLNEYALNLLLIGKNDEGITILKRGLEIYTADYGNTHPVVAAVYNNLGTAFEASGEAEMAEENFRKSLEQNISFYGDNHPEVGVNYNNIGQTYKASGKLKLALEYYEKALEIFLQQYGEFHSSVATTLNNMGLVYISWGKGLKALGLFQDALRIGENVLNGRQPAIAIYLNNIGLAYKTLGNSFKALSYYHEALKIDIIAFGELHPNVANRLNNIGSAYSDAGDEKKALEYYQKALKIDLAIFGEMHSIIANRYNNIGMALLTLNKPSLALDYFFKAIQIYTHKFGNSHPDIALTFNNIAAAYLKLKDRENQLKYLKQAIEMYMKIGDDDPNLAIAHLNLSMLYFEINEIALAKTHAKKSVEVFNASYGVKHPYTVIAKNYLEKNF